MDLEDWTRHATPPVQCGRVARWIPHAGRFLCDMHYQIHWCCNGCEAPIDPDAALYVPGAAGGYCAPTCAQCDMGTAEGGTDDA